MKITNKSNIFKRGNARSRRPLSPEFVKYMSSGWEKEEPTPLYFSVEKSFAEKRRANISSQFIGDRLIVKAGDLKVRSNDTDYRFRPHTAFAHLTGLGMDFDPGAILVFEPTVIKTKNTKPIKTHFCTLYIDQMKGRDSEEFFGSASKGEFWIGKRPGVDEFSKALGITVKDKSELSIDTKKIILPPNKVRIVSDDLNETDPKLLESLSELRLIKDNYEIKQMRAAIDATKDGFERMIKALPKSKESQRGERVIEGEFFANAIEQGNGVGYESIIASGNHATTLHWQRNNGQIIDGELILIDAGVEMDSLYTADITRTLPINGKFNGWQRNIYEIVLKAADAAFEKAKPGNKFRDVHDEAMRVIVDELIKLDILKVSAEESLSPSGQQHRRWMCHGTSHHLGMDVHDCAHARETHYLDGVLEPGMIFTIEPGLYFKEDDLLAPAQYRGIGVRIEDDILITDKDAENLSASIPRNVEHVESWMKQLWSE